MRRFSSLAIVGALLCLTNGASAALINVDTPGDPIISLGHTLAGGPNVDSGGSPGGESVDHVIDGVGQKYLNFGETNCCGPSQGINSGYATTTAAVGPNIVTGITVFTANDSEGRDPNGFTLEGSNGDLTGPWTLIATSALALPSSRQNGGANALDPANSQTILFANSVAYDNYRVLWTGKKDLAEGCCIQVGEVQLLGQPVPEPASVALLAAGTVGLALIGWRRRRAG